MSLRSLLKGELVVVPNVGHLPNVEDPLAFNEALLSFLGVEAPPAAPDGRDRRRGRRRGAHRGTRHRRRVGLPYAPRGWSKSRARHGAGCQYALRGGYGRQRVCGFSGELDLARVTADAVAVAAHDRNDDRSRARRRGPVVAGGRGARPPPPEDHRPVRAGRPADGRRRARPRPSCSTAASTTTTSCGASSRRTATASSRPATPRCILKAYRQLGRRLRRPPHRHVRLLHRRARQRAGRARRATASASSRSTWPRSAASCASRRRCRRSLAGGGVDTSIDPVALHHYLTFHAVVPAPRTILRGRAQAAAGDAARRRARRPAARDDVLAHRVRPPTPSTRDWSARRLGGRRARRAAHRRRPSPGGRRARRRACCPAASTRA